MRKRTQPKRFDPTTVSTKHGAKKKNRKQSSPKAPTAATRRSPRKKNPPVHQPSPGKKKPSPSRVPRPPPSKRSKKENSESTTSADLAPVYAMLKEMAQQQAKLVDFMYHSHHHADSDGKTLPNHDRKQVAALGQGPPQANLLKHFIETNMEMSRLIEENAALKREKLVRDMVTSDPRLIRF